MIRYLSDAPYWYRYQFNLQEMFTEEERAFICLDWCQLTGRKGKATKNADGSITVSIDGKMNIINVPGRQHRDKVFFVLADGSKIDYNTLANIIAYIR